MNCGNCIADRARTVALVDGVCPVCLADCRSGVASLQAASGPRFTREPRPPARTAIVAIRVSVEEQAMVDALAKKLGMKSRAEVVRKALDYFLASPEVRIGAIQSDAGGN